MGIDLTYWPRLLALSGRVPSLYAESAFGRTFPRFYVRGLGNTDFDLNANQPVSLVYDGDALEKRNLTGVVQAEGGVDFNNFTAFVNEPTLYAVEVTKRF